jgi:hypothetical protein
MKNKDIDLPKGGTLNLEYTEQFMAAVRVWAKLDPEEDITDYHVRMYIYGAMKNAMDKDINLPS